MATQTLTIDELAEKVEAYLRKRWQKSVLMLDKWPYEDMLLVGPDDKQSETIAKELAGPEWEISCTKEEIRASGRILRRASLKARGLQ